MEYIASDSKQNSELNSTKETLSNHLLLTEKVDVHSTAERAHKDEAVPSEDAPIRNRTTQRTTIKPNRPTKAASSGHKFFLKIAKSGIYITFKKGHKNSILKKLTKSPFARRLSKN